MAKSYGDLDELFERAEGELHECAGMTFLDALGLADRGVTEPLADHIAEGKLSKTDRLLLASFIAELPQKQPAGRPSGVKRLAEREVAASVARRKALYRKEHNRKYVPQSVTEKIKQEEIARVQTEQKVRIAPSALDTILASGRYGKFTQNPP